jgi:hypothetical protein
MHVATPKETFDKLVYYLGTKPYSVLKWNPIDCLTIPTGGVQDYV